MATYKEHIAYAMDVGGGMHLIGREPKSHKTLCEEMTIENTIVRVMTNIEADVTCQKCLEWLHA